MSLYQPAHVQVMHPWESITTQLGSHFEKSNDGQPPAPGIAVVGPGVPEPPEGAGVVALEEMKFMRI